VINNFGSATLANNEWKKYSLLKRAENFQNISKLLVNYLLSKKNLILVLIHGNFVKLVLENQFLILPKMCNISFKSVFQAY